MHEMERERTPFGTYVYCGDCHNPDGFGVGRADYLAHDETDAAAWFNEHKEAAA